LPDGPVLVVGASASGVQIADELRRAGRDVMLAAGRHFRLPRNYRGMEIMWWLDAMGHFTRPVGASAASPAARPAPSVQLIGDPSRRDLDLGTLQSAGVRLAGRLVAAEGDQVRFAGDLATSVGQADAALRSLLSRIDQHATAHGLDAEVEPATPLRPVTVPSDAPVGIDLERAGVQTVVWATGFRRSYPWLRVPVLDERGEIRHQGGVTPAPGLYVLGMRLQRSRASTFIDGVGADAAAVVEHLASRAPHPRRRPTTRPLSSRPEGSNR
jgi:putative flavoprotein involved in K+ transport